MNDDRDRRRGEAEQEQWIEKAQRGYSTKRWSESSQSSMRVTGWISQPVRRRLCGPGVSGWRGAFRQRAHVRQRREIGKGIGRERIRSGRALLHLVQMMPRGRDERSFVGAPEEAKQEPGAQQERERRLKAKAHWSLVRFSR